MLLTDYTLKQKRFKKQNKQKKDKSNSPSNTVQRLIKTERRTLNKQQIGNFYIFASDHSTKSILPYMI